MNGKQGLKPETALRLLAVHVTNVAVANPQVLNDRQRKLIHHSARILRDVANMLSPPTWNPRQRWDKIEEKRKSGIIERIESLSDRAIEPLKQPICNNSITQSLSDSIGRGRRTC